MSVPSVWWEEGGFLRPEAGRGTSSISAGFLPQKCCFCPFSCQHCQQCFIRHPPPGAELADCFSSNQFSLGGEASSPKCSGGVMTSTVKTQRVVGRKAVVAVYPPRYGSPMLNWFSSLPERSISPGLRKTQKLQHHFPCLQSWTPNSHRSLAHCSVKCLLLVGKHKKMQQRQLQQAPTKDFSFF